MKLRQFSVSIWRDNLRDLLLIFFVITPITGTTLVLLLFRLSGWINDSINH